MAFYEIDNPGKYQRISDEGVPTINPWLLSLTDRDNSCANGFWFLYQDLGPSWAVASPDKAYPFWDSYYFQAAVQPETADGRGDDKDNIRFKLQSEGDVQGSFCPAQYGELKSTKPQCDHKNDHISEHLIAL